MSYPTATPTLLAGRFTFSLHDNFNLLFTLCVHDQDSVSIHKNFNIALIHSIFIWHVM
jgi:hypothetical protein